MSYELQKCWSGPGKGCLKKKGKKYGAEKERNGSKRDSKKRKEVKHGLCGKGSYRVL
jgi:hypothetical protein